MSKREEYTGDTSTITEQNIMRVWILTVCVYEYGMELSRFLIVANENPYHAVEIFWHKSCRFCGRGGGGVTPGLLDTWHVTTNHSSCRHVDVVLRAVVDTVCVHIFLRCTSTKSAGSNRMTYWGQHSLTTDTTYTPAQAGMESTCNRTTLCSQSGTAIRTVLANVTCAAERETWMIGMSHDVKPTH